MNTIGKKFAFTSFGESHGQAIGGVVDGCPPNVTLDLDYIQSELNRRRPGQSNISTPRSEDDKIEIVSGVFEGKTTGTPIAFFIWNKNQESKDYNHLKDTFRPSHADYTYTQKYAIRDHRGGGRSSARTTAGWVAAGAIAKLALRAMNIEITAYTSQVGNIKTNKSYNELDFSKIENSIVRCPDSEIAVEMVEYISRLRDMGDSVGGVITCVVKGVSTGLGEPVFGKLQARLAEAMLSINAAHGFDYGSGFDGVALTGSQLNDPIRFQNNKLSTLSNHSGGIQGGISNGEDIYFRVLFKPVATISISQRTVDINMQNIELSAHGRHDPCVLPRAVPIVEALTAITLLDSYMLSLR